MKTYLLLLEKETSLSLSEPLFLGKYLTKEKEMLYRWSDN